MSNTYSDEAFVSVVAGKLRKLVGDRVRVFAGKYLHVRCDNGLEYEVFGISGDFAVVNKLTYRELTIPEERRGKAFMKGRGSGLATQLARRYNQLDEFIKVSQDPDDQPSGPLPQRQVTVEIIDELIRIVQTPEDTLEVDRMWDKAHEYFWGGPKDSGVMLDILTLARIALVHLRGSSFLVHEGDTKLKNSESLGSVDTLTDDAEDKGNSGVADPHADNIQG